MYDFSASVIYTEAPDRSQGHRRLVFLPMQLRFAQFLFKKPVIVWRGVDKAMVDIPLGSVALRNGLFDLLNRAGKATVEEDARWGLSHATDWGKAIKTRASSWGFVSSSTASLSSC